MASTAIRGSRAVTRALRLPAPGYGPLHQGGDGAGSIRMPAQFSGVYGLKPTHGRVPNWPMSNNDLTTHIGPLTRTVTDAALMLRTMAGPHPWDYTSLESTPPDYAAQLAADLRGKRIAYCCALTCNSYGNNVSRLTLNVLQRFLDPKPF